MKKVGVDKKVFYSNIPKTPKGWVDAKEYLPADFDMCALKIKTRSKDANVHTDTPWNKKCRGWHTGNSWDGLWVEFGDEILFWKKLKELKGDAYAAR